MKKVLNINIVLILLLVTMLFMSCEENKKEETHYLTVSYHSEGHTEGEVPIDDNRYELVRDPDFPVYRVVVNVKTTNLKKGEDAALQWLAKESETKKRLLGHPFLAFRELKYLNYKAGFSFGKNRDMHIEFHAIYTTEQLEFELANTEAYID